MMNLFGLGSRAGASNIFDDSGVGIDQKIIEWVFKQRYGHDVQPISTDQFMDKSKDTYNSAWLGREIIQNFVDGNDKNPYSLDGVDIKESKGRGGKSTFSITGDWSFVDPTGIISLHSEKPTDRSTAGGNGIGLKQVALRLLRDYGVNRFEVEGEKWKVKYGLAEAEELNSWIDGNDGIDEKMKHDWLVGKLEKTRNTGKCTYTIETDNEEVIQSLRNLLDLGVGKQNTYLKNPDFVNEKGAIKWLKPEEEGRLFVNGQVMNFKTQGETAEDYWKGPEGVTLQLNDIDYKMSIDRPPVKPHEMKGYMNDLIESMSVQDCIEQLQKSKHIWESDIDTGGFPGKKGSFVVIEKLVDRLWLKSEYSNDSFQTHFPNEKYLAVEHSTTASQMKELREQGFILCPQYLKKIGMPIVSTKLDSLDVASNERPSAPRHAMEKIAQENGIYVAYQEFQFGNAGEYFQHMQSLGVSLSEREGRKGVFRLIFPEMIDKSILFHRLDKQNNLSQKHLHEIRGMIAYGLKNGFLDKVFISTGEYVSTFKLDNDSVTGEQLLLTRNNSCHSDEGCFLEFEMQAEVGDKLQAVILSEHIQSGGGNGNGGIEPIEVAGDVTNDVSSAGDEGHNINANTPGIDPRFFELGAHDLADSSSGGHRSDLSHIPVMQPQHKGDLEQGGELILVNGHLPPQEADRIKQFGVHIPEIVQAVNRLDEMIPIGKPLEVTDQGPVEDYKNWRGSGDFYGQGFQRPEYLTGRHLLEILSECNQADIDTIVSVRDKSDEEIFMGIVSGALENLVNRLAVQEEEVNEFEIILSPTKKQVEKLMILREFIHLGSGVLLPNDLFLYNGTGTRGINIGQKAIGLHASLLEVSFKEALSILIHEIAHNHSMGHGNDFIHALQSLFADISENILKIAMQAKSGGEMSDNEERLLALLNRWNEVI